VTIDPRRATAHEMLAKLRVAPGGPPAPLLAHPAGGIPVFREVREGEIRVEGTLVALECGSLGVTVVVDTTDGRRRFPPAPMAGIEFISYRNDLSGPVTCGRWQADGRTVVTFRPVPGSTPAGPPTGTVVAIEFPPGVR
jgi:hypothetical protein